MENTCLIKLLRLCTFVIICPDTGYLVLLFNVPPEIPDIPYGLPDGTSCVL